MTETSLTMISLGPNIPCEAGSLVRRTSRTDANDAAVLLVKDIIMQMLFSLPT